MAELFSTIFHSNWHNTHLHAHEQQDPLLLLSLSSLTGRKIDEEYWNSVILKTYEHERTSISFKTDTNNNEIITCETLEQDDNDKTITLHRRCETYDHFVNIWMINTQTKGIDIALANIKRNIHNTNGLELPDSIIHHKANYHKKKMKNTAKTKKMKQTGLDPTDNRCVPLSTVPQNVIVDINTQNSHHSVQPQLNNDQSVAHNLYIDTRHTCHHRQNFSFHNLRPQNNKETAFMATHSDQPNPATPDLGRT
jgi:hypothetical protein